MLDSSDALNVLIAFIKDYFNENELRNLCFEINVEPDEALIGMGFSDNVLELVGYVKRRGRLEDLIVKVHQTRERVDWPEAIDTLLAKPNLEQAETGIRALQELAKDQKIKHHISQYQNHFETTLNSLKEIRYYKLLHDLFQEMELRYNLIANNERPRLEEPTPYWSGIITTQSILEVAINDLRRHAEMDQYTVQTSSWLPFLERGQETFQTAVSQQSKDELDTALRFFYRALDRGITRVNGCLVDAANALPFEPLINAMKAINEKLTATYSSAELAQQLSIGIEGLEKLNSQLRGLVKKHNDWQRLDDELRRVDSLINLDIDELEKTWSDIKEMAIMLFYGSVEFWATELKKSSERLDKALVGETSQAMVTGYYNAYRLQVSRQFRFVDDQLLELCENLGDIVNPLNMLLSIIPGDFVE